jgi:hypothetical protein
MIMLRYHHYNHVATTTLTPVDDAYNLPSISSGPIEQPNDKTSQLISNRGPTPTTFDCQPTYLRSGSGGRSWSEMGGIGRS